MSIEAYKDSWRETLFTLYGEFEHKYYSGARGKERWSWRRRTGVMPWFDRLGFPWLYFRENALAGTIDCLPNLLSYEDQKYTCLSDTDFFIRDAGRPMGISLILELMKSSEVYLCANGPPEVLEIYEKLGFKNVGKGHRAWQRRLVPAGRALLMRVKENIAGTGASASVAAGSGLYWDKKEDFTEIENISASFGQDYLKGCRSTGFLEWRVGEHPDRDFEVWVCRDDSGKNIGYTIFRRVRRRKIMPYQAIIFDFALAAEAGINESDYIDLMERLFLALSCDVATYFLISPWEENLEGKGYELVWKDLLLMYSKIVELPPTENWHLTLLDTEKLLYF
ncbi:MAG: hypothetical protein JXQ83_00155 [Candidatus Glassbacteria bacterium]|nr:hypothetical protein [Candidatus Glassbacteria bacterium]